MAIYPVPFLVGVPDLVEVLDSVGVGCKDNASLDMFLWIVGVGRPRAALLKSVKDLEVPILRNGAGLKVLLFRSTDLRGFLESMSNEGRRGSGFGLV